MLKKIVRVVVLAAVCCAAAANGRAQAPNPDALADIGGPANPQALDFAPIDLVTLELGLGAAMSFEAQHSSVDLRAGLLVASAALLGLRAQALRLAVTGRPGLHASSLHAELLKLDALMIGTSNVDSSLCPAWPGALCDGSTGFVGVGGSLLDFQHDMPHQRSVLRLGELALVFSASPAFAAGWSRYRLLARVGASLDHFWFGSSDPERWRGRLLAGIDGALRAGRVVLEPAVRFRPSASGFTQDFGIEATLDVSFRTHWRGLDAAGDALRVALQLGWSYWSLPAFSQGVDFTPIGRYGVFIRLLFAPTVWSVLPPGDGVL